MKIILSILKQLLFAPFFIYLYNLVAMPINLIIPINFITILIVGLLGIPGLIALMVFKLIAF